MRKNISGQIVAFQAISSTDGSDVTTGSPVVYYTIDGGTQAQTTASAVHEGNGQWTVALTQAETNGDHIAFSFVLTGAISQTLNVYTIDADITNLDAAISSRSTFDSASDQVTVSTNNDKTGYSISGTKTTLDDLNDIAASAIVTGGAITTSGGAVSNVTLVATTTTNTDMRGTDNAFLAASAPANFGSLGINASGHLLRTVLNDTTTTNTDMVSVTGLSTFDPATDQVIVGTNNDKTGYSLTTAPPTAAEIYTEFVSGSNEDAFKADVTGISAQISALNDLSTTDGENSVWDAAYASHTTAGTFGKLMDILRKANRAIEGQVAGTPTASAFDTDLTGYTSGAFDHETLVFLSGALEGEARPILSYDATNGRITFEEALTAAPSASDEFAILPFHVHPISEIVEGIFNEPQAGYTTAGTFGYYLDSQVSAAGGAVDTAAIADAVWDEVRSPDHVTEGTFGYYVDAQVSSAGAGGSGLYQVTVNVQNQAGDALQGARINVDGTTLTLVSDSAGQCVFNLDSGIYLLEMSPPAGYQTPVGNTVTVTTSDTSSTFTLTATTPSGDCDIPWVG